jgi:hypothetical protein
MPIPTPRTSRLRPIAFAALTLLLAGCAKSCQKTSGPRAARDDLALSPRETDIVIMANLKRARGSALWQKVVAWREGRPEVKQALADFTAKCKFDPLTQIDSLYLALPQDVEHSREFAFILRGSFPAQHLIDCLKATAEKEGRAVTETEHNKHKLYTVAGQEGALAVLSPQIGVLAGKEWIKKVIDLHAERTPGQGAKDHKELADLMARARIGDALWGVGLVPQSVGDRLRAQPELGTAASMKSLLFSIDFDKGVAAGLTLDLASPKDAEDLSARVGEQLQNGRKAPAVQAAGLVPYFDTIKVSTKERAFSVQVTLAQAQVDDLSVRLGGLMKLFGQGRLPGP